MKNGGIKIQHNGQSREDEESALTDMGEIEVTGLI